MAERRTPRAGGRVGPRGGRATAVRPGRGPASGRRPTGRGDRPTGVRPVARVGAVGREVRSRFTGRAAVLVLVLAVLAVSYASSLRAYLDQRAHIAELKDQIAARGEAIDRLEREKRRWEDDSYVRSQARERFGYLMPGETGYQVLDEDGLPLETDTGLSDPDEVLPPEAPPAWWDRGWASVELAGNPPDASDSPARRLEPPTAGQNGR